MMARIMRGALLGIFLGIVGGLAIGGLTYQKAQLSENNTAILAMSEGVITVDNTVEKQSDEEQETDEQQTMDISQILRFHIRGNSDSVEDQMVKMEVKEYALSFLEPVMEEAESLETAKRLIEAKMPFLKTQLEAYMQNSGYTYNVEIYFTTEYFPLKQYGDVTFPAGEYDALRIDIGEVEGQNWWCVMYPSLCFIDATHAVLPLEEKEKLAELLTEDEYNSLVSELESSVNHAEGNANGTMDEKNVVYYHSKLIDTLKKWICK